ncbi:hypothetical protein DITRI_Ditri10aG0172300 [Diplodiscus trichospermus]
MQARVFDRLMLKRQREMEDEEKVVKKGRKEDGSWSVIWKKQMKKKIKEEYRESSSGEVKNKKMVKIMNGEGKKKWSRKGKMTEKVAVVADYNSHKGKMIVLAWNCHGVGSTLIVQALKELKKKFDPDLIFLMETKNKYGKLEIMKKSLKMEEGVYSEPKGLSGGIV